MKGKYIGTTYVNEDKNEVWLAKGDIVEIVKFNENKWCYNINVLSRTCETNKRNRARFGCDWAISIKDIILFDNNKLDIE